MYKFFMRIRLQAEIVETKKSATKSGEQFPAFNITTASMVLIKAHTKLRVKA